MLRGEPREVIANVGCPHEVNEIEILQKIGAVQHQRDHSALALVVNPDT
jgi:hypothetical protein